MIYQIKTAEQAVAILRAVADTSKPIGAFVFDLDQSLNPYTVPSTFRRCSQCSSPGEYLGWNIWGEEFSTPSTYCPSCGYCMDELAGASLVVQGDRVFNASYRPIDR